MTQFSGNAGAAAKRARADLDAVAVRGTIAAAIASGAVGLAEIAAHLNEQHVPAPYGGTWHTETVRRILKRLKKLGYPGFEVRTRSDAMRERYEQIRSREAAIESTMRARKATLKAENRLS
jgi:Recombinase